MPKFLNILIYSFIMIVSTMFIWHSLLQIKINFKNRRTYITFFSLTIITALNYYLVNNFIKIILITFVFMLFVKYLFNKSLNECIIMPIFYQIIIMVSEGFLAIILSLVLKLDTEQIKNMFLGTLLINAGTSIISVLISLMPVVKKLYYRIINTTKKIKQSTLLVISLIVVGFANIFARYTYYKSNSIILVIVNIFFTLFCCVVVYYSFKMKSNYNKVNDKYNITINSLRDYEAMINKNRIENHENKNMLLTIRAMILNKEKDIPKYIDSIVKEKYVDNENLLKQISIIPSGGLRATVYSEIQKMQSKNINCDLYIDSKISLTDFIDLDTNTVIDICKIIGVFIDNAIDEVQCCKEKSIGISIFIDDSNLKAKISNMYIHKIDLQDMFNEGYTTKGDGHGYGLPLVKKIIASNPNLSNEVEVNDKLFSQILCIKLNTKPKNKKK